MSDLSISVCEVCNRLEYECSCSDGICADCGCELSQEEIDSGRDTCFDCYCDQQD
jgi:hypothetical protein